MPAGRLPVDTAAGEGGRDEDENRRAYVPGYRITAYLKNGGTLEHAQHIANHSSPRTTKLYDRRRDEISLDEIERIAI